MRKQPPGSHRAVLKHVSYGSLKHGTSLPPRVAEPKWPPRVRGWEGLLVVTRWWLHRRGRLVLPAGQSQRGVRPGGRVAMRNVGPRAEQTGGDVAGGGTEPAGGWQGQGVHHSPGAQARRGVCCRR